MKLTPEQVEKLAHFLDALDEWGCTYHPLRARYIADFIAVGFNLAAYEESQPLLTVVGWTDA